MGLLMGTFDTGSSGGTGVGREGEGCEGGNKGRGFGTASSRESVCTDVRLNRMFLERVSAHSLEYWIGYPK